MVKRNLWFLVVVAGVLTAGSAAAAERWVHVKVVQNGEEGERVRVNIPLSLAEKVLPTINANQLHAGKIRLEGKVTDKVDLRTLLAAIRDAPDNEFVTVDSKDQTVQVAKSGGFLLIKVRAASGSPGTPASGAGRKHDSDVDVKVPFAIVSALLAGDKDELNVLAAVQALGNFPDIDLVTVRDADNTVRIWVDSKNVAD